jgi:hypothetical protein
MKKNVEVNSNMLFSLKILFCVIHWMNLLLLNFYIMNPTILTFIYDIPQWNKSFILNFFPLFFISGERKREFRHHRNQLKFFCYWKGKNKFLSSSPFGVIAGCCQKYTFFLMWNDFLTLILLCGCFVWIEFFFEISFS